LHLCLVSAIFQLEGLVAPAGNALVNAELDVRFRPHFDFTQLNAKRAFLPSTLLADDIR